MPFMKQGSPFLYDNTTGDVVGVRDPDGSEAIFVKAETNTLTGGITWSAAEFAAITPEAGKFYLVEA